MRKLFLVIGIISALAAGVIVFKQKGRNPFSRVPSWLKANKELNGRIHGAAFSPNGEYLVFLADDETGEFHNTQTYLYSLSANSLRKLDTNKNGYISGRLYWAPDSLRLGFDESKLGAGYSSKGRVFNIRTNLIEEEYALSFLGWSPDGGKQLFYNINTKIVYVKETGNPVWFTLPKKLGEGTDVYCWSGDSQSFLYCETDREIYQYRLGDTSPSILAYLDAFPIKGFLFPSQSTSFIYYLSRGQSKTSRPKILCRVDSKSGQVAKFFDCGPDQEVFISPMQIFFDANDNPIYYVEIDRRRNETRLLSFNSETQEKTIMLKGQFYIWDYSIPRGVFAFSLRDDRRLTLKTLDVKTREMQQISPPN